MAAVAFSKKPSFDNCRQRLIFEISICGEKERRRPTDERENRRQTRETMAHVNGALKVVDEFSAPTAVWLRPSRICSFCLTRVDETDSECERHVVTVDWFFLAVVPPSST